MSQPTLQPYRGETPDPAEATRDAMAVAKAGLVPIVEVFYSLQGEGLRSGEATVFVRTAGCNCDCWFCDTDFRVKESLSHDDLVARIEDLGGECRWACLTGGEPTIHALGPLVKRLHAAGWRVQVETNGTRPRAGWALDHITVSPKELQGARLDPWYYENATEFKYVIDSEADLEYALTSRSRHDKPSFLQPNALNPAAVALCIGAVQAHPAAFRLSLQTHKLLNIR